MSDKEQVIEQLQKMIEDREHKTLLCGMCDEIFEEYKKGSAKATSSLLQNKIGNLKRNFDDVYNRLLKKMGL